MDTEPSYQEIAQQIDSLNQKIERLGNLAANYPQTAGAIRLSIREIDKKLEELNYDLRDKFPQDT